MDSIVGLLRALMRLTNWVLQASHDDPRLVSWVSYGVHCSNLWVE